MTYYSPTYAAFRAAQSFAESAALFAGGHDVRGELMLCAAVMFMRAADPSLVSDEKMREVRLRARELEAILKERRSNDGL